MGNSSIAKTSLLLGVDGSDFSKGLDASSNKVKSWGNALQQQTASGLDKVGQQIKIPALKVAKPKVDVPPPSLAGFSIPPALLKIALPVAALAGAALAVKALGDQFVDTADKARLMANAARDVGADLKGFNKLSYAAEIAGVAQEDLRAGLLNLRTVLASSDEEAGRIFGQIGLSVADLRKIPIDEAAGRIADALKGVQDPLEQARIGIQVLGPSFANLTPFLNKGQAGLAALGDEARKMGRAFDEADNGKLQNAAENIRRLGGAWEGLKNQLSIALAPAIEAVTDAILNARNSSAGLGEAIGESGASGSSALQTIVKGAGWVIDAIAAVQGAIYKYIDAPLLQLVAIVTDVYANFIGAFVDAGQAFWEAFGEPITAAFDKVDEAVTDVANYFTKSWQDAVEYFNDAWAKVASIASTIKESLGQPVQDAIDNVVKWFSYLKDKLTEAWNLIKGLFKKTEAGNAVRSVADGLGNIGDKMVNNLGETPKKFDAAFNRIEERAKAAADNMAKINPIDKVKTEMLKSLSDLEAELLRGMKVVGLTGPQAKLFDFEKKGANGEQLAKLKDLADQAKNVDIAFGNVQMPPLETFERSVKGLDTLLENGRINLEQYQRGIVQASKNLQDAVGLTETKTVSAQLRGSKEAVTSVIKAELQDQRQDPQAELKRAMAEAQEIRKKQLAAAEKLIDVIEEKNEFEFGAI